MDLTEPASAVLPLSTAALLRVLAGADDAFTGRQLARMARVSHAHAAKVVDRLAAHGLVLVEERGGSKLCRLNRAHLMANALIDLVKVRKSLFELLADHIAAWSLAPIHASLFGSAARGDGSTSSDLDVLLVRPVSVDVDSEQWTTQLLKTAMRIREASGNDVAWFDISVDDLQRAVHSAEPIMEEWRRDGLRLAGEDFVAMLRKTS